MKGVAVITLTTCLYLVCLALGEEKRVDYTGNQVWKIAYDEVTPKLLRSLEKKNYLSVWGKTPTTVDVMINAKFVDQVEEELRQSHLKYEVSIKNLQQVIDESNPKPDGDLQDRRGHKLTWRRYHKFEDIQEYLYYIAATYPHLCSVHTIGHSVEGRPIHLLKISKKSNDKAIFIEGGIHAREWISPSAVTYIINKLTQDEDDEPQFLQNIDWYIVPVLNPDGYEYTHDINRLWRKNRAHFGECEGVDLNRNWDYHWSKNGSSTDPCNNYYRGPKPFSEPETTTVANFFASNKNINWKAYLAIHSYGQYVIYPWGSPDVPVLEDSEEIRQLASDVAAMINSTTGASYTVGPAGTTVYSASGTSMDWARGALGIKYSYTIELRDTGHYGFLLPASFIEPTTKETFVFVKTIAKTVGGA